MKRKNISVVLGLCLLLVVISCSKDKDDPGVPNASDAQLMAGSYNVVEYEKTTNTTKNYVATVTRVNDTTINITDVDYPNPVNYHWTGDIAVNISKKYLKAYGTTVYGTITDKNNWQIKCTFGSMSNYYYVTQTFTRK